MNLYQKALASRTLITFFTIILQFALVTGSHAQQNSPLSYNDLAQKVNTSFYSSIIGSINSVGKHTFPHDVKCLRKDIGKMKTLVDIFIYAYGQKSSKKDPISNLRGFLDEGYAVLGDYKDEMDKSPENAKIIKSYEIEKCIYGVPPEILSSVYDKNILETKLKRVLKWIKVAKDNEQEIIEVLSRPKNKKIAERKKSDLSRFIWGSTSLVPNPDISGYKNLQYLQLSIVQNAIQQLPDLLHMDTIHDHHDEEFFHDFRKRIRMIVRIDGFFPQTRNPDVDSDKYLDSLDTLVGKFGDLNDLFLLYHEKQEKGENTIELVNEINSKWRLLKSQLLNGDVEQFLISLQDIYIF